MTLFEYLTAAHTLILTLAVIRALSGVADAATPGRRYWVHLSWLGLVVALCLTAFWAFWSYIDVEWTMPRFVGALAAPALIYVYSSILVPPDPSAVESWRDYFFMKRVPLFATLILLGAAIVYSNQVILDVPPMHSSQLGSYTGLAILSIGLASARPLVHAVLALGPPLLFARILLTMAQPGSLVQ